MRIRRKYDVFAQNQWDSEDDHENRKFVGYARHVHVQEKVQIGEI